MTKNEYFIDLIYSLFLGCEGRNKLWPHESMILVNASLFHRNLNCPKRMSFQQLTAKKSVKLLKKC